MSHKYKLLWKVDSKGPDGVDAADVPPGSGATDALLLASIIYPPDGSLSIQMIGLDGRKPPDPETGEPAVLDDVEWFKVWSLLSSRLAKSETLSDDKRVFCATVFETFCRGLEDAARRDAKTPPQGVNTKKRGPRR